MDQLDDCASRRFNVKNLMIGLAIWFVCERLRLVSTAILTRNVIWYHTALVLLFTADFVEDEG